MEVFYRLCVSVSIGVIVGFLVGGIKFSLRKKYTDKQIQKNLRVMNKISFVLKYSTLLLLVLGFIWCVYYLVLGATDRGQADYANNMSENIVAVLTVISIIFEFFEFLRHTGDK